MISVLACARPVFDPAQLPGALFDADADQVVTGATMVWTDRTGLGNSPSQSSGANQPSVIANDLNGHAALSFTTASQWLENTTTSLVAAGAPRTVLIVAKATATGVPACLVAIRRSSTYQASTAEIISGVSYCSNDGTNSAQNITVTGSPFSAITSPFYGVWIFNGAGLAPTLRINGVTQTIGTGVQGTESGLAGFQIGRNATPQWWSGKIYRTTIVSGAMAVAAAQRWEAWVRARYGLT